jgi:hypothetical protein
MFSSNSQTTLDHTRFYQPLTNREVADWVTARNAKGKTTVPSDLNRYTLKRLQQDQLAKDRNTAEGSLAPKEQAQEPLRNWIRLNLYDPVIPCISVTANIPIGSLRRASNSRPMASELVANLSLLDQNNKRPNTNFVFAWNIAWNKFFAKLERRISPRSAPLVRLKYVRVYETASSVFSPTAPLTHTHLIVQVPAGSNQSDFTESFCRAFDHFIYPLPRQDRRDATSPFATDPNPLDLTGRPLVIRPTRWNQDDLPQYIYDTKQLYGSDWMDRVDFDGFERNINKKVLPTE